MSYKPSRFCQADVESELTYGVVEGKQFTFEELQDHILVCMSREVSYEMFDAALGALVKHGVYWMRDLRYGTRYVLTTTDRLDFTEESNNEW